MAGFDNDVMFATNVDFTGSTTVTPQVTTNGQLLIGSTVAPKIRVGSLANNANMNVAVGAGTITLNPYNTAKWIVDPTANLGTHQTITAALAAASSGETIFIRPGTYTENLTLKAGVDISAFTCDAYTPNVKIIGKCAFTTAGTISISGICLQTNSDFALAVTGSAASIANLINCQILATNNTAISYTSSSASSGISLYNCVSDIQTTGIALFASSGAGSLVIRNGVHTNTGVSTTASTASSGGLTIDYVGNYQSAISVSGTANPNLVHSRINCGSINTTAFTTTSSSATQSAQFCRIDGGTASAISAGAGTLTLDFCAVSSSNANAITGAGTIQYGRIVYTGTSSTINTTTQTARVDLYGISRSTTQPAFSATHTVLQTDVTGNGATATVNFTTEIFDQNANYDATNTFTAPLTGRYHFNSDVFVNGAATSTQGQIALVTSNRSYGGTQTTPFSTASLDQYRLFVSSLTDMDAADTATIACIVSGMVGDTADIPNNATNTYFNGYLEC